MLELDVDADDTELMLEVEAELLPIDDRLDVDEPKLLTEPEVEVDGTECEVDPTGGSILPPALPSKCCCIYRFTLAG